MKILFITTLFFLFAITASAQCPEMPPGFLCVTREAAQAGLEAGDKAKALEVELKARDEAHKTVVQALNDMRIEFARVSGENTALKQNAVSDRAIMEILLKNTKKKCLPFALCVF